MRWQIPGCEVESGSALVEVGELLEHNAISFDAAGAHMELAKKGLYRIDAGPAALRVYEGQALVSAGSERLTARKGHQIDLTTAKLVDTKFDSKDTDAFYRWSSRRAEYVAAANVISARVTSNSDYRSSFAGNPGAWSWNPYFGMFTFLPANGVYWSPFGSAFYSPGMVWAVYTPRRGSPLAGPGFSFPTGMRGSSSSMTSAGGFSGGTMGGGMRGGGASAPSGGVALPGVRSSGTRGR